MNNRIVASSFLMLTILCLGGCATTAPQVSPMQMRQFTTRNFEGNYENVFRATMTVLQDQGYIIKNTDMNSGLIVAQIDREASKSSQFWQAMFSQNGYIQNKGTLIETSVTVNKLNEAQSEIRMIIEEGTYGSFNNKTDIKTITDPKVYDAFLNDVLIEVKRREAINHGADPKSTIPTNVQAGASAGTSAEEKSQVTKAFDSALSK